MIFFARGGGVVSWRRRLAVDDRAIDRNDSKRERKKYRYDMFYEAATDQTQQDQ
jgi:hypothetical protein